jgi:hypothetical protein
MLMTVWLQVRVLPGPTNDFNGLRGASRGRSRSDQRNGQFFPRPVTDEGRRRPQVIRVVMTINAV